MRNVMLAYQSYNPSLTPNRKMSRSHWTIGQEGGNVSDAHIYQSYGMKNTDMDMAKDSMKGADAVTSLAIQG